MRKMWAKQTTAGFTIVELLVVIVVIGVLAAITLIGYNGIQNRANDVTVRSDLSNIAKKQELFKLNNPTELYAYSNTGIDFSYEGLGAKASHAAYMQNMGPGTFNLLNCTSIAMRGTNFAMLAISKSGKRFYVSSQSDGVQQYTGTATWLTRDSCTSVLPGSVANGAGYAHEDGWRAWAR